MYLMPDTFKTAAVALLNEVPINFRVQAVDDFLNWIQDEVSTTITDEFKEKVDELEDDIWEQEYRTKELKSERDSLQDRVDELEAKI